MLHTVNNEIVRKELLYERKWKKMLIERALA